MYGADKGLRLTTNRIRSKGTSRKTLDLNKQLKGAFKLSAVNAKRREVRQKKNEKTLKLAATILDRCEDALRPVDYEGLISSIEELDRSYKTLAANTDLFTDKGDDDEDERVAKDVNAMEEEEEKEEEKTLSLLKRKEKQRTSRAVAKKTLAKSHASFKKKLDRITEAIRTVERMEKLIMSLKKRALENERKTKEFKKQLCVDMKSTFDPLFLGSIGYENGPRTDPYGDNLSKSQWDSKTSKS